MTDALVQTSRSITLSQGISLTETGAVIDDGVSLDAWGEALQQCQSLANASIWALGDLLVYAQNHAEWGETYTQFLELTGKSYSTLTKASYLSRRYASTDRVEGLSWSHHMEAAAIKDPNERRELLLQARSEGWTREQIRSHQVDDATPKLLHEPFHKCPSCGHRW